jgi:PAS domain S-box-containing protein
MGRMNRLRFPKAETIEKWPWAIRGLLGIVSACVAVTATYSIHPLRSFPLLLAFATVILTSWFLGMWGGVMCALTDVVLVDLFLTRSELQFSVRFASESLRMAVFLVVSTTMGWAIRALARQRSELTMQQLQQQLMLADAERKLAEERATASEALRYREELLQIALGANGMGLWVWDVKSGAVHRSDEMFRMLGLQPGAFSEDPEAWLDYVHPEDRQALNEEMRRVRETGSDYHRQYRIVWPDGTVRWVESQGKCQKDNEGGVVRVMGVLADITHRKQAEESMLRAEKLAVAGKLAASVAHEINNPLAAVANLLYLITLSDTTEAAHARARDALDELMRISLITQQTLKFHRQTGAPQSTQLSDVVESVMTLFRGKLHVAQIAVEVRVREEVSVPSMAGEMQQIFANLLSNAIEAMPRGGRMVIRLRSSLDWRDYSSPGMRVSFFDTGSGMSRSTMRRVFEPFFTTKAETGTGLGMWVVAQLVERHGGHVRGRTTQRAARSGTVFSVFFPLKCAIELLDMPDMQAEEAHVASVDL